MEGAISDVTPSATAWTVHRFAVDLLVDVNFATAGHNVHPTYPCHLLAKLSS
jgi:hypothetical protein